MNILDELAQSLDKARVKHNNMHNSHEAYAIIKEEFDEVWEEIRKLQYDSTDNTAQLRKELLHTAAMCIRAIEDCKL